MHTITKIFAATLLLTDCNITVAWSQPQKIVLDKIIAVVGDRIILQSDIDNLLDHARSLEDSISSEANCLVVQQALASKVLLLQAKKDSIAVADEDVEAELDQRIRYHIKILGSREKLEEYANKPIYQIKENARETVRENRLAEAMQQKIVSTVRITPTEVKAFFEQVPGDALPFIESRYEVGQIIVSPHASAELEQYIIDELNTYKRQIENRISSFEQLARLYSEHMESKKNGGRYLISRNEKLWNSDIVSTSFRMKDGEISAPIKSGHDEYFLVQMVKREGDEADIRLIMRSVPLTEDDINLVKQKLDTIRSKIITGAISFNAAAGKFSDDPVGKLSGPFILNNDGSPYILISQMDNELVAVLSKMKPGELSAPMSFTTNQNRKAVRLVYLKSQSSPHRLNLSDDYTEIAQAAIVAKKEKALDQWMKTKMPGYYIMLDGSVKAECPDLWQYISSGKKEF